MGHPNQLIYFKRMGIETNGRVLEVGSKNYGNGVKFRDFFEPNEYLGIDLESGDNVDLVHDISKGRGPIQGEFDLIICCSVLEHCVNPWRAAETITDLLKGKGRAYISVPWIQRYHAYPDDYWRFTLSGLRLLFPGLRLSGARYSTFTNNEFLDLERFPDIDQSLAINYENRKYLPCYELHVIGEKIA